MIEKYYEGNFLKWNNNAGAVILEKENVEYEAHTIIASFCHYTYIRSKGQLMVVDIQGWHL